MIEVIERSRALGEAIVNSDAFRAMQLAESEAESDPAVKTIEQSVKEMTDRLKSTPDGEERLAISSQLEALKQSLTALPAIERRDRAREGFSRLMEQVNNILQFTITGEISALSSCSGNCGGCSGCGSV